MVTMDYMDEMLKLPKLTEVEMEETLRNMTDREETYQRRSEEIQEQIRELERKHTIVNRNEIIKTVSVGSVDYSAERVQTSHVDQDSMLRTIERANKLYLSQFKELVEESMELDCQLRAFGMIRRSINENLCKEDKRFALQYLLEDLDLTGGADKFNVSKKSIQRMKKRCLYSLTLFYNQRVEADWKKQEQEVEMHKVVAFKKQAIKIST